MKKFVCAMIATMIAGAMTAPASAQFYLEPGKLTWVGGSGNEVFWTAQAKDGPSGYDVTGVINYHTRDGDYDEAIGIGTFLAGPVAARHGIQYPCYCDGGSTLYFTNTGTRTIRIDGLGSNASYAPEPATWAMMIGGFGLTGAALRRRRRLIAKLV